MSAVQLRLGRRVLELPFEEFEDWARTGRIPPWLWMRYEVVTGERWVQAGDLELFRALADDRGSRFERDFGLHRFAVLTVIFLVLSAAISLIPGRAGLEIAEWAGKDVGQILERAQWWRLFTYAFVHTSPAHFLVNAVFVGYLGWLIENAYGRSAAFLIVVVSVLAGSLLSLLFFVGPTYGSSALVFGLFGAVLAFGWKYEELIRGWYKRRFGWAVFPYLVLLLVLGTRVPGIDNLSHLGGFLGGCITALMVRSTWEQTRADAVTGARFRTAFAVFLLLMPMVAGPFLGGPAKGGPLPVLDAVVSKEAGYSLEVPGYWMKGEDFLGFEIVRSPSNEVVFGHSTVLHRSPPEGADPAARLAEELAQLDELYVDPDSLSNRELQVAGLPAAEGCLGFYRGMESYRMCRVSVLRGRVELQLSLRVPARLESAYRALWVRILSTVAVFEPGPLLRARSQVSVHPEKWTARLDLARELSAVGRGNEAWAEAEQARDLEPEDAEPVSASLLIALHARLHSEQALELAMQAPDRFPGNPAMAQSSERLLAQAGQYEQAALVLLAARARFPVHQGLAEERAYLADLPEEPGMEPEE